MKPPRPGATVWLAALLAALALLAAAGTVRRHAAVAAVAPDAAGRLAPDAAGAEGDVGPARRAGEARRISQRGE